MRQKRRLLNFDTKFNVCVSAKSLCNFGIMVWFWFSFGVSFFEISWHEWRNRKLLAVRTGGKRLNKLLIWQFCYEFCCSLPNKNWSISIEKTKIPLCELSHAPVAGGLNSRTHFLDGGQVILIGFRRFFILFFSRSLP